jgi:hypothetical protein
VSGDVHVFYGSSDPTGFVDFPVPWQLTTPIDSSATSYGVVAQLLFDGSLSCTLSVLNSDGSTASAAGSNSGQYNVVELLVCNNSGGDWAVCPYENWWS